MKYLYFDVECANCKGGHGKICTFGYVLADENFNVIFKDDIIINPKLKKDEYDWYVVKNLLSYSVEEIESHLDFKENYETIKNLLTNPNHITLGFDVYNDLKYINQECARYGVPKLQIKSYDVQDFYSEYTGEGKRVNLFKLADTLKVDKSMLKEHNSRDDAQVTMLVAKAICDKMNVDISSMLELCDKSLVDASKKRLNEEKLFYKKVKSIAEKYEDRSTYQGICISDGIKYKSMNGRLKLIKQFFKNKYNYVTTVGECNYFVYGSNYAEKDMICDCLLEDPEKAKKIKKITINELSKMLNAKIDENCELIEEEKIDENNPMYLAFKKLADKKGISIDELKNSL